MGELPSINRPVRTPWHERPDISWCLWRCEKLPVSYVGWPIRSISFLCNQPEIRFHVSTQVWTTFWFQCSALWTATQISKRLMQRLWTFGLKKSAISFIAKCWCFSNISTLVNLCSKIYYMKPFCLPLTLSTVCIIWLNGIQWQLVGMDIKFSLKRKPAKIIWWCRRMVAIDFA